VAVINQRWRSFMDNITHLVHGTNLQYHPRRISTYYLQSSINIIAPDGSLLQHIGHEAEKDASQQMRDEVHLVSCLFNNIHHDIDLSQRALYGLADLMYRVQEFCDKNIK
jgi:hypothetical protein